MVQYRWKGVDLSGKHCQGMLQADSPSQLTQMLLAQHIALLEYTVMNNKHSARMIIFAPRITAEQQCNFFERLALLIASGVELVQALTSMAQSMEKTPLGTIASALATSISAGQSFQQALANHPRVFAPFVKQLVTIGEQTGHLALVLEAIARHLRQQAIMRQELKHAALGPLITLGAAGGLMVLIVLFVTPQFETLYHSLGSPLPPATARLIAISALLRSWYGLGMVVGSVLLVLGITYLCRRRTFQSFSERLLITMPVLSSIIIMRHQIMFMQTIALFIASGISLASALENMRILAHNQLFKNDIQRILNAIVEGKSLSAALIAGDSLFFNQELATLVAVGERTGRLDDVLGKAGSAYQQLLTRKLQQISTLFAPILMLLVGLLITGLMAIMYLPIINLGNLFHF